MTDKTPSLSFLLSSPVHLVSLGFGTGLAPFAPGTFGTLVGFPLFFAMAVLPLAGKVVVYLALFALGCWLCGKTGNRLGVYDHSAMVFDEIIAMALVLEFTPSGLWWWVIAFGLFRLFDILKPWPVSLAEKMNTHNALSNGLFVMLDDVLAAIYAIAVMLLLKNLL